MYKDADGRLYAREELDAAPGNILTEYVPAWRVGVETFATFHEAEDAAFSIAGVPFSVES